LATRASTEARIFDGALRAIARQGPKKLAMSDIAHEAGVSVGTLYRYFKNKDELLQSLGDHFVTKLQAVLQAAIEDNPEPADRLQIVIDVMLRFWLENPATVQIGQLEPGFVLDYIKRVTPRLSAVLRDALEPVLSESAAVRDRGPDCAHGFFALFHALSRLSGVPRRSRRARRVSWARTQEVPRPFGAQSRQLMSQADLAPTTLRSTPTPSTSDSTTSPSCR
jgi:AcrR family transcriptional regulator